MQLGSIETFLTQKIENMQSNLLYRLTKKWSLIVLNIFEITIGFEGLPLDKGSLLYRLLVTPDDIDMENVDIDSIKVNNF